MAINVPQARIPVSIREQYPDLYDWIQRTSFLLQQIQAEVGEEDVALNYDHILFDTQVVPTGSNADLFTLTSSGQSIDNLKVRLANYTASNATVSMWCQSASGTEADADYVLEGYTVAGHAVADIDIPRMVGEGNQSKLTVTSDTATAITVSHLSGIRRS